MTVVREDDAMVAPTGIDRSSVNALACGQELGSSPEAAFALICEVEKWPVWLSFATSARRVDEHEPLGLGSEIVLRAAIPGEAEELYEVDRFVPGHAVSLVGAYSIRRRIDFRIEQRGLRAKLVVRVDYPSYGGVLGALVDRVTARRRIENALSNSLVHFKGLVEFNAAAPDELLADF